MENTEEKKQERIFEIHVQATLPEIGDLQGQRFLFRDPAHGELLGACLLYMEGFLKNKLNKDMGLVIKKTIHTILEPKDIDAILIETFELPPLAAKIVIGQAKEAIKLAKERINGNPGKNTTPPAA